jgi:hypothetical protein
VTAPITITVDCHSYPWHARESWMDADDFPEVGPDNLTRMAETFGILIRFLPDHPMSEWAWWYEVTGPYEHLVRFLTAEYTGDEELARDMIAGWPDGLAVGVAGWDPTRQADCQEAQR